MARNEDDTVRLNVDRVRQRPVRSFAVIAAIGLFVAALAAAGAWFGASRSVQVATSTTALAPPPPVAPAPPTTPAPLSAPITPAPPPAPITPAFNPPLTSEADILASAPEETAVYRFALQSNVVILQFPTLAEQGRMLNRIAALIEKAGFPRDRVLAEAELDARIVAAGGTPATFYYGHDYRTADLRRFFDVAAADGVTLTEGERRLQVMLGKLGWQEQGIIGALISLVRQSDADGLDLAARATILRHELSHALYFTDATYAGYVHRFWTDSMNARDRELFTAFLVKDGYDPAIEDLIINETQAYLMFTRDPRFFSATALGMPQARLDLLRRQFLAGMPPSWLRDLYAPTAAAAASGAALPK